MLKGPLFMVDSKSSKITVEGVYQCMGSVHYPVFISALPAVEFGYDGKHVDLQRQLLLICGNVFADLGGEDLAVQGRMTSGKVVDV